MYANHRGTRHKVVVYLCVCPLITGACCLPLRPPSLTIPYELSLHFLDLTSSYIVIYGSLYIRVNFHQSVVSFVFMTWPLYTALRVLDMVSLFGQQDEPIKQMFFVEVCNSQDFE